jgi:hypothetical protein
MVIAALEGTFLAKKAASLFDVFNRHALSWGDVVKMAVADALNSGRLSPAAVKSEFSSLVGEIESKAFSIYLTTQREAWAKAIEDYIPRVMPDSPTRADVIRTLSEHFDEFDRFFLSLAQSRKARAGQTFQTIIKTLFRQLGYPFSEQPVIDGKPDFILPSKEHFRKNPVDCIIFTVKRTVRERWRQIVTEGTRGLGFFLASIDRDVSVTSIEEMGRNRIFLVVPKKAKLEVAHYSQSTSVIDFETFFSDYLDPAVNRWRKAHLI